ncbi:TniQ protein [Peribacillus simplex]|uniref:TniQ protein n=2 Tax=Peribacillus simplex TaxID=1478 RepID=A0A9X8R407_9BACI|nr:TniQ protein [Peribacillus simplex]
MLLFRPEILKGESLTNYLYRLAAANRYPSISYITELINVKWFHLNSNSFPISSINELSKLTLYDYKELYNISLNYYEIQLGMHLGKLLVCKNRAKYCPLCINNTIKHKTEWNLHFVNICDEHHLKLIDSCVQCHYPLSISSLMKSECINCGYSLEVSSKPNTIRESDVLFKSHLIMRNMLYGKNPFILNSYLSIHDYMELATKSFYLIEGLSDFTASDTNEKVIYTLASTLNGERNNKNMSLAFTNVYWMYNNFPNNFYKVLDAFYQKPFNVRKYQKKQFEKLLLSHKFFLIKLAYEEFWEMQGRKGNIHSVALKKLRNIHKDKKINFTKKELTELYGLTRNDVNVIWNNKRMLRIVNRGGKEREVLPKESLKEIEKYIEDKNYLINLKETAHILGLPIETINILVKLGYLNKKIVLGKLSTKFDSREIDTFLFRNKGPFCESEIGINLQNALKKYKTSGLTIKKIFNLIYEGKLTPFTNKKDAKLKDIHFRFEEIEVYLNNHKNEENGIRRYSLREVKSLLKMDGETIHKMILKDIIKPVEIKITKNNKKRYFFSKNEIDLFIKCHIGVQAAVKEYPISEKGLLKLIKNGELKNVVSDISRINLIKRTELTKVIFKGRKE